jgi:copper chaperone CopZ
MKAILISSLLLLAAAFLPRTLQAQAPVTATFQVSGVCGMCKARIEGALDVKGVKFASWSSESQEVTVVYKPGQITEDALHARIAAVGHDTGKVKAKDEVYAKLPGCCKYRNGVQVH